MPATQGELATAAAVCGLPPLLRGFGLQRPSDAVGGCSVWRKMTTWAAAAAAAAAAVARAVWRAVMIGQGMASILWRLRRILSFGSCESAFESGVA